MNYNHVVKPLSHAQLEEFEEVKKVRRLIGTILTYSFVFGTVVTLVGLKLIKTIVGVESFGFNVWVWLGVHFLVFWVGVILSFVLIGFVVCGIVMLARWSKVT